MEAIRLASRGESFLQPSIATRLVAEFSRLSSTRPTDRRLIDTLSDRELEVLQQLTSGKSNRQIAATLYITEGTVKNHMTSILGKLGVSDRTQAALKARELGIA
jgi:DNA-binding NarL/FixJ family response regulator